MTFRVIGLVLTIGLVSSSAFAQGEQTGTVTGTVRDTGGLVLPGATITTRSPSLQGTRTTTADANGVYVLRALPTGVYKVSFSLDGFTQVDITATVELGRATEVNASLAPAGVAEAVTVNAPLASALTTTQGGANYRSAEIDNLAMPRTLSGIAELAPGLTNNTPNSRQLTIAGAFAYDNVFLVDGVDVNDNLFGDPNNLFIEDAIEEMQVLTSGISAEHGRFSGGVVNAITKRGGDIFSGSFRTNLTNPSWTDETPFEQDQDTEHPSELSKVYEGTLGGPILRSRLWFFGAGRYQKHSEAVALSQTGIPLTETEDNKRYEIKLTGTVANNHTLQGSYLNNDTKAFERVFSFSIDPRAVHHPHQLNDLTVLNYKGVLGPKLLAELQYSRKKHRSEGVGGTSTDLHDSPFISLVPDVYNYNAPYFDATDPEDRNNQQIAGSLAWFMTTPTMGSHDIKGGFEVFTSTNAGGNSQSATNFVFWTNYLTDVEGRPVLDAQSRFIPVFDPEVTFVQNWLARRGSELDIRTSSFYVHDRWAANKHWSFDLGLRYERVRSETSQDLLGLDTDTIVPRLAASFDPTGTGTWVFQTTYAHYAGRYSEAQFGENTNVGNPDRVTMVYVGPPGVGHSFAPGFDFARAYVVVDGEFNAANVKLEDGLSSPVTKEFTVSAGRQIGPNGYAKASYSWRKTSNFVEDFTTRQTGSTSVDYQGELFEFSNRLLANSDVPRRNYQAVQLTGRYRLSPRWSVNGHWTVQVKNDGNFEGEATNQPGISSPFGDVPEIVSEARHFPIGKLGAFQRNKIRAWTIYTLGLGRAGSLDVSGLWRYDSGLVDSYVEQGVRLTATQRALGAGYASLPSSQNVYYGERGAIQFDGAHLFDAAINYQIPVFRSVRPWLKLEVRNLFNNDTLVGFETAVTGDPSGPRDSLGLPVNFIRDPQFGTATENNDYPTPRTFLMAFGFRF